jgi:hypothetical protein
MNRILIGCCVALLLVNGWLVFDRVTTPAQAHEAPDAHAEEDEPELAAYMTSMQQYSHKLMLSVQARNAPAAGFYLHELEELSETIVAEVETYEGYEIAALTSSMLMPQLENLDAALDGGDWSRVDTQIEAVTQSCNQCHEATDHGFIRIQSENLTNPYNQTFEPLSSN